LRVGRWNWGFQAWGTVEVHWGRVVKSPNI
jgi:hypothetical protein